MGIPLKLKDRLKGTTEDEIRADAELLSGLYSPAPPLASSEHTMTAEDEKKLKLENGYKEMAKKFRRLLEMSEGKILEVKNYKTVFTPELVTDLFQR